MSRCSIITLRNQRHYVDITVAALNPRKQFPRKSASALFAKFLALEKRRPTVVLRMGKGALLVKADIKEAYRMLPVHSEDQPLLGVQWEGIIYTDQVLPFGL